jgi:hypothetical protein
MTPPPRSTAPDTADDERKAKRAAYVRAWRAANADKIKAQRAADRAANPETVKATNAAYYAANREKIDAKRAARRAAAKLRQQGQ